LASTDLLALVMVDELGKLINSTPLDRGIKRDFLSFSNLSLFRGRTGETFIAAKQKDLAVGMNCLRPHFPL